MADLILPDRGETDENKDEAAWLLEGNSSAEKQKEKAEEADFVFQVAHENFRRRRPESN